ncbi:MAG: glutamate-1-semialdehyde 2,1-aminomutase [Candidatus Omnitrophica bacterium]|nr:glutamate-1-semialdehyde 2,1-aminomutase [Candidatus Omnitrophota bacterium]
MRVMSSKSEEIFERSKEHLVGGVNSPVRAFGAVGGTPRVIERAKGCMLTDVDGKNYIDYVLSWGPLVLGHAHPAVLKAVREAVDRGTTFGAPTKEELALAELIKSAHPSIERIRFVSSGTEAAMTALRLARGVTGRKYIVKFSGCYHGHTDSLLVSAGSGLATFGAASSAGVPNEVANLTCVVPYNDPKRFQELMKHDGNRIAAVIVEPVAGNMGLVLPDKQFLVMLRAETVRYKALLIFDEVISGFRIGWGGAENLFSIKPDLACLGKIIGGGFPAGAVGGKAEYMEHLSPVGNVYQAGTLSGNPVAMAAGRATLEWLKKENPYPLLEEMTKELVSEIRRITAESGFLAMINQIASMFTVFCTTTPVKNFQDAQKSDTGRYAELFHALLEEGIYFPPSQFETCFLSTAHAKQDIKATARAFEHAVENVLQKK